MPVYIPYINVEEGSKAAEIADFVTAYKRSSKWTVPGRDPGSNYRTQAGKKTGIIGVAQNLCIVGMLQLLLGETKLK